MNLPFSDDERKNIIISQKKKIVFEEKGKKYIANNLRQEEICEIEIDHGLYPQNVTKCDKGLIKENKCYLVELKGTDVGHACEQLLATLLDFKKKYNKSNYEYFCRAVVTQMPSNRAAPNLLGTAYQKLQKELKANSSNGKFKHKTKLLEENV